MRDLRSTDGKKLTFMNHGLGIVLEKHPDLVSLLEDELELVVSVSTLPFEHILGEANQLVGTFAQIKTEYATLPPNQALLHKQLTTLLTQAENPMAKVKQLASDARSAFEKFCQFFHEDPKKTNAETVFRAFASLTTSFSDLKSQRERAAANAARQEKIRQMKEAADQLKRQKQAEAAAAGDSSSSATDSEASDGTQAESETAVEGFRARLRKGVVVRARQRVNPTPETVADPE